MKHVLLWTWLFGSAGALLYHVVGGWPLDWVVGVAVWGIAMGGLGLQKIHTSDRRAMLDMVMIATPTSLFAVVTSALAAVSLILVTPALLAAIVSCVMVAAQYITDGVQAARRSSPPLSGRR